MNFYSSQRKTNPYLSSSFRDNLTNQFSVPFLHSTSPKPKSKLLTSSCNKYNTSYRKTNIHLTTINNIKNNDVRLGEIKMNLDILNDKLNKLKNIMNDNPLEKKYNGSISYRQRSSNNNQIKSTLYNGINGRNINNINQNTSFDAFDNNVIDFDNNVNNNIIEKKIEGTLVQSPINFEIKTPIKNVTLHEKDITSTNLSQIADDLVSTLELENGIQTHVDNLKSFNEINFTLDNKFPPKENTFSISSSVVNIQYDKKPLLKEIIEKEEEKQQTPVKDESESENEDDLIIQEIMKKVQEDNEKAKQRHIAFNTKENILINYKDTNEITNFQVINEESKEKIVFTPRKMHLYTQILKSKNKPKSAIKPFNCKDIKINEEYNPDDLDDYEEEEEEESEEKEEEGSTINNIRNMFNKEEVEESKEEDVEEYKENRRQYSS